VCARARLLIL